MFALNATVFPQSKATMKLYRICLLSAAVLGVTLGTQADLASILTNAQTGRPMALPRRTSIILIVCHGLGYGDLSCYGQTNYQTPNLDRLAAAGLRFTDYYAGNGEGSSARVALLTGRPVTQPPAANDADRQLQPGEVTVAQRLLEAGYHTGFIGEWGLGLDPWARGFQEFAGLLTADDGRNYYPDHLWRHIPNAIHDRTNHVMRDFNGPAEIHANIGHRSIFLPEYEMSMALKFMKNNEPDNFNHHQPYFLMVDFAVPRSAKPGADEYPVPSDAPYTDEAWPQAAKNRVAMISRLDAAVGQLLQRLAEPGFTQNVAVFVTSDAGPEAFAGAGMDFLRPAGDFRGHRGELYEGALRVPMFVYWPDRVAAGRTSDVPWAAWDFARTALDIAFVPPLAEVGGQSVLPVLTGQAVTNRDEVFTWALGGATPARAARLGNWKMVRNGTNAPELYDLGADPQERTNTPNAEVAAKFAALGQ